MLAGGMVLLATQIRIHRFLPATGAGKHVAFSLRMIDDRLQGPAPSIAPRMEEDAAALCAAIESAAEPEGDLVFSRVAPVGDTNPGRFGPTRFRAPPTVQ